MAHRTALISREGQQSQWRQGIEKMEAAEPSVDGCDPTSNLKTDIHRIEHSLSEGGLFINKDFAASQEPWALVFS
jgi:hypothetical protein